jgi:hypothetical protein
LEFATWDLLIDSIDSRENLEKYLNVMRERCLGLWDIKKSELGDNMKRPTAKKKPRPWTKEGIQVLKAMVREKTMTSVIARKLKRSPGAMRQRQLGSA